LLRTRAEPLGWNLIVGDPLTDLDKADVFGALLQYPASSGAVRDLRPAINALRAKRVGGRCRRSAGADANCLARRNSAPISRSIGAAFWRADGLWRAHPLTWRCAMRCSARCPPHRRDVGAEFAGRGN